MATRKKTAAEDATQLARLESAIIRLGDRVTELEKKAGVTPPPMLHSDPKVSAALGRLDEEDQARIKVVDVGPGKDGKPEATVHLRGTSEPVRLPLE